MTVGGKHVEKVRLGLGLGKSNFQVKYFQHKALPLVMGNSNIYYTEVNLYFPIGKKPLTCARSYNLETNLVPRVFHLPFPKVDSLPLVWGDERPWERPCLGTKKRS